MDELTREIYGNIGTVSKIVFYLCAIASVGVFCWGIWRRRQLWRIGRDAGERIDWRASFDRLRSKVMTQRTVRKTKRKAGKYHAWLFYGFIVLFIGTCLIAVEEWGHRLFGGGEGNLFHKGLYFVMTKYCSSSVACCSSSAARGFCCGCCARVVGTRLAIARKTCG